MEFLFLAAGIMIGGTIVFLFMRGRTQPQAADPRAVELDRENAALKAEIKSHEELHKRVENDLRVERERRDEDLKKERIQITSLSEQLARKDAELRNAEEKLTQYRKELETLNERFTKEFENLANRIFEEKSRKFTEQNKTQLSDLLNPLGEKIKDFEKKVQDVYVNDTKERASLKEQLLQLQQLNQQMSRDAQNLTTALTGEKNKTAGTWGEMILESILERSGLVKGQQYRTQVAMTGDDGNRYYPDVVIDLPGNKHLVVDSKVSLVAYERFSSAEDEEAKTAGIRDHVASVRKHIKDLSEKNYQKLYSLNTVDFVLLFMPLEPAFSAALQNDRELFNYAFDRNIVIVSPTTLLATLRTVDNFWKQEMQNRNVMKIADEAAAMYEKFAGFTEAMIEVGKKMDDSKKSYETAMNRLVEGSGNVVKRIENLKKLGIKVGKSIDPKLIERAEEKDHED